MLHNSTFAPDRHYCLDKLTGWIIELECCCRWKDVASLCKLPHRFDDLASSVQLYAWVFTERSHCIVAPVE